jgi:hypothetical protein
MGEYTVEKEGIVVLKQMDTLKVNLIANNVAEKICNSFPECNLNRESIFVSLSRINMYIAQMPEDSSNAKFCYKNNSIYFREGLDYTKVTDLMIHECIHFIQKCEDEQGNIVALGLYKINGSGMGLNEAAVQLMASYANKNKSEVVKYFDITIPTISPNYYTLGCSLLNQIIYFTGAYPLFSSTLTRSDVFKEAIISRSNKKTYYAIEKNLDRLLNLENHLFLLNQKLANSSYKWQYDNITISIRKIKASIRNVFLDTQSTIIENMVTYDFNNIHTVEDAKLLRSKLYNFKDLICYTDDYDFYNKFYVDTISAIESIENLILAGNHLENYQENNVSLVVIDNSFGFINFFKTMHYKLKKVFGLNKEGVTENQGQY